MNNERPTSSASSTTSDSSSSPGQTCGPCNSASTSNGSNSEASGNSNDNGDNISQYLLNIGFAKVCLLDLCQRRKQQAEKERSRENWCWRLFLKRSSSWKVS